jgi:hypothetical protein
MMCFHGDKQLAREIGLHDMTMTSYSRRMSIDVDLLQNENAAKQRAVRPA